MPVSKGFLIASGFKSNGFPVAATGTLDFATVQPGDTDTIVINGRTYTFKTALSAPAVADEIFIGATAIITNANTIAAINAGPGEGTLYSTGTVQNVEASRSREPQRTNSTLRLLSPGRSGTRSRQRKPERLRRLGEAGL
jgi:hypothetical protein